MDKRHFTQFYHTYVTRIYKFVFYRVGGNKALAEDVTQDVFLKAFEAFDRYDPSLGRVAWLYTIARHHLINVLAKMRPQVNLEDVIDSTHISDMQDRVLEREDERQLFTALSALSPDDAKLVRMKYLEGWSFDDLAEIFGKSSGSLRVQALRAMRRLKTQLKTL